MAEPPAKKKNSLMYQLRTFKFAFKGLRSFFISETKSRIHLVAALAAIILGIVFAISAAEWIGVAFAIGFVFMAEIGNTAVEELVDLVSPQKSTKAGLVKDLAAAAVLVAAITALAIGLIIFIPKLIELL